MEMENNHVIYRGKDCMKRFCESLREHAMEKNSFLKKRNEVNNQRTVGTI